MHGKEVIVHDTDLYSGYYLLYKSNAYTTRYAFNEYPAYEKKRLTSNNTGKGNNPKGKADNRNFFFYLQRKFQESTEIRCSSAFSLPLQVHGGL